jgi:hypothetical protein
MPNNGKPAATGLVADPAKVAAARDAIRDMNRASMMAFAMELAAAGRRQNVTLTYGSDGSRMIKGGPSVPGADPALAKFVMFVEMCLQADPETVAGATAANAVELRGKLPMPDEQLAAEIAQWRRDGLSVDDIDRKRGVKPGTTKQFLRRRRRAAEGKSRPMSLRKRKPRKPKPHP